MTIIIPRKQTLVQTRQRWQEVKAKTFRRRPVRARLRQVTTQAIIA